MRDYKVVFRVDGQAYVKARTAVEARAIAKDYIDNTISNQFGCIASTQVRNSWVRRIYDYMGFKVGLYGIEKKQRDITGNDFIDSDTLKVHQAL